MAEGFKGNRGRADLHADFIAIEIVTARIRMATTLK